VVGVGRPEAESGKSGLVAAFEGQTGQWFAESRGRGEPGQWGRVCGGKKEEAGAREKIDSYCFRQRWTQS